MGTLTSWNSLGPSEPVAGLLYLYLYLLPYKIPLAANECDINASPKVVHRIWSLKYIDVETETTFL